MRYTVESTEAFEKEFSKNHRGKKEWLLHMVGTGAGTTIRKTIERKASWTIVVDNSLFQSVV